MNKLTNEEYMAAQEEYMAAQKENIEQLLSMSIDQFENYVDRGHQCDQDTIDLFEEVKRLREEVERLKKQLQASRDSVYGISCEADEARCERNELKVQVERLREENEQLVKRIEHLANKPIAVFGEGFGYEEHYRWLKNDLKSLAKSIQRIQEEIKSD